MASSLSAPDLKALWAVNEALLDPLSHETIDGWLLEVCARFRRLCFGSAGLAGYSFRDQKPRWLGQELPEKYLQRISELHANETGSLRTDDPQVDKVVDSLRSHSSGVATTQSLLEQGGLRPEDLEKSPMFREVALPLDLSGSAMLFHSGASGEFLLQCSYPELERVPFGAANTQVLSVLLPGFTASLGALARLGDARRAVAVLLDALDDGAAVFDSSGRKQLARNSAAGQLMCEEPDKSGLEIRMLQAAAAAVRPAQNQAADLVRENRTALAGGWQSSSGVSYRLRTVRLPAGSLGKDESILVLIQRVSPAVPAPQDLRIRFGLTLREAQVARLLAIGRSDREIAAELSLSRHTVRHHAEAVFLKIGVTSRKALALHLGASSTSR